MKIQKLYKEYMITVKKYEKYEKEFDKDWMNRDLEKKMDKYYDEVHYPAFIRLEKEIKRLTGLDNRGTIIKMIESDKFKKLMQLKVV